MKIRADLFTSAPTRDAVLPGPGGFFRVTPTFTILVGPGQGTAYPLEDSRRSMIAGRSVDADIHLPDASVSRRHARFFVAPQDGDERVKVIDMGSTNGTFVNGARQAEAVLLPGDRIHVGNVLLRFDLYDPQEVACIRAVAGKIRAAQTDHLTGLATRGTLEERGAVMVGDALADGAPLAALMIDLDYFKRLNDTHGHAAGDAALRGVGRLIGTALRGEDLAARYGGEEIAVLLPGAGPGGARLVAERLRALIAALVIPGPIEPLSITASIGLAMVAAGDSLATLLARADTALYRAKAAGRNRVATA